MERRKSQAPDGVGLLDGADNVAWYQTVFELIDMRSFSSLWYWIGLAVLWSSASHWVLGVPHDMIQRARRFGAEAQADLEVLVAIYTGRLLYISGTAGLWITAFASFVLSALGILAVVFGMEFAQAVLLMLVPMILVAALSLRTARQIRETGLEGEALIRRLIRHRMTVQAIGMVAIFVTAMFGMWQNMQVSVFG
jgi:hypothetical protein